MANITVYVQDKIKKRLDEKLPKEITTSQLIKKFLKAWIKRGCPDPREFSVYIRSKTSRSRGEDDE